MFRSSLGRVGAAAQPDPGSREAAGYRWPGARSKAAGKQRAVLPLRGRKVKVRQNVREELD